MSNASEWVSHNLERQRRLLDEKQRQRRMQPSYSVSSSTASITNSSILTSSNYATTDSGQHDYSSGNSRMNSAAAASRGLLARPSTASHSVGRTPSPGFSAGLVLSPNAGNVIDTSALARSTSPMPVNALYSLGGQHSQKRTSVTSVTAEPRVITVKGFSPPTGRRGTVEERDASSKISTVGPPPTMAAQPAQWSHSALSQPTQSLPTPDKPVIHVNERLEPLSANVSPKSSINGAPPTTKNATLPPAAQQRQSTSGARRQSIGKLWEGLDDDNDVAEGANPTLNGTHADHRRRPSATESICTEVCEQGEKQLEVMDIINSLDTFVMEPTRKNATLRCKISRDKKGVDKGMYPVYYLHLEKNDGRRVFLLAARRRKKSVNANYLISTDPTDLSRDGRSFTAKVRCNAMGTTFTLYDNGENPKKATVIGDTVRRELAAVLYDTNVLGLKGPRKMTIIIPAIFVDEKINYSRPVIVRPISERDSILERYKSHRLDEMVVLHNKQPVWNEETQSYVLNFHGRVTQASVKNFQIVHSQATTDQSRKHPFDAKKSAASTQPPPSEYVIMQFGRVDNETFTMDVRYPLSPVQAFGIAMTSFHGKLACE